MPDLQKYRVEAERMRREAIASDNLAEAGTLIEVGDLYDRLVEILEKQRQAPELR